MTNTRRNTRTNTRTLPKTSSLKPSKFMQRITGCLSFPSYTQIVKHDKHCLKSLISTPYKRRSMLERKWIVHPATIHLTEEPDSENPSQHPQQGWREPKFNFWGIFWDWDRLALMNCLKDPEQHCESEIDCVCIEVHSCNLSQGPQAALVYFFPAGVLFPQRT